MEINMANLLMLNSNALTFWFLNHSWLVLDFFLLNVFTLTLDIFSYLFITCTRKWSKRIIKTINGGNSYHLCSWHQWPFGVSSWFFQKIITKSKSIQLIIYKRHQIGWHLKYLTKLASKTNFQKIDSFFVRNKKILCVTFLKLFPYAFIFHIKTHFFVNLFKVLNFTWLG